MLKATIISKLVCYLSDLGCTLEGCYFIKGNVSAIFGNSKLLIEVSLNSYLKWRSWHKDDQIGTEHHGRSGKELSNTELYWTNSRQSKTQPLRSYRIKSTPIELNQLGHIYSFISSHVWIIHGWIIMVDKFRVLKATESNWPNRIIEAFLNIKESSRPYSVTFNNPIHHSKSSCGRLNWRSTTLEFCQSTI